MVIGGVESKANDGANWLGPKTPAASDGPSDSKCCFSYSRM
jgi:hypothetical protein